MLQLSTTVNVEYPWLLKQTHDDIWFYALEAKNMTFKGGNYAVFEMTVCARYSEVYMYVTNLLNMSHVTRKHVFGVCDQD